MAKLIPIRKPHIAFHAPPGLTHGAMTPVRVVLHDTESHDEKGIGDMEGVVNFWLRGPDKLGAHFIVDAEGNVGQCGEPTELMFHTLAANTGSVGIEQIGFASFTKQAWASRPDQLMKVAKLLAWLNDEYGIPLRHSTVHGVSTHADQTKAHNVPGGHTDPGANYPFDEVLAIAKGFKDAGGWPPDNQPAKTRKRQQHVYHITFTDRHHTRKTVVNHSPGLWLTAHPRAKHRGDIVIHPVPKK
jgi:hypothetical protein